jgi:transcriptional regulator with XRE-family HTH domain
MPLRGDRIKEFRERKGLTQRELAEVSGVTLYQISRYENDRSDISADSLEAIARHLGVSTDYLLGLVDDPGKILAIDLLPDQAKLLEAYESGDSATIMELVSSRLRRLSSGV